MKRGGWKLRIKYERVLSDSGQVIMNMIRVLVSDLRLEWIMIKRDIFDIYKEIVYFKKDYNDVINLMNYIQDIIEMLKKIVENFKFLFEYSL